MSLSATRYLRASFSISLRPISSARSRWWMLSQCLILLRARELRTNPSQSRLVPFLGQDLDDVAVAQLGAQWHHPPVDLAAGACVPHLGVHGVGEVHHR